MKAVRTTETKTVTTKVEVPMVTVTMTPDQAMVIASILGNVLDDSGILGHGQGVSAMIHDLSFAACGKRSEWYGPGRSDAVRIDGSGAITVGADFRKV